jgi:outer membrane protein OmpA-like peptidoglycan-associated protein
VHLDFESSLDALAASSPGLRALSGPAHVEVGYRARILPDRTLRERTIAITSPDARLGRLPLGELRLVIVSLSDGSPSSVSLDVRGPAAKRIHLEATLNLEVDLLAAKVAWRGGAATGALAIEGLDLARVTLAYPVLALEGALDLRVTLGGASDDPRLDVALDARDVTYNAEPVGLVALRARHAAQVSDLDLRWGPAERPILTLRGALPLALDLLRGEARYRDDAPMDLALSAPSITPRELRPVWYAPLGLDFDLALGFAAKGSLDTLAAAGAVRGAVTSGASGKLPLDATFAAGPAEQSMRVKIGAKILDLALTAPVPLADVRRTGARAEPAALTGALRSTLPFSLLVPFLPADLVDPEGALVSTIDVAGTLGAPTFAGSIETRGAAITLLPWQQRLRDVALVAKAAGNKLTIASLSGKMGLGALAGRGEIVVEPTPASGPEGGLYSRFRVATGLGLAFDRLPVVLDGMPIGTLAATAKIRQVVRPGDTRLDVEVSGGRVELTEHSMWQPRSIPKNPAVHEIDALGNVRPDRSFFAGRGHMRFDLKLATPFELRGAGSALALTGGLTLDRDGTRVRVDGGLAVRPGSELDLFDNPFVVKAGLVTLLGGEAGARKGLRVGGGAASATLADPDQPVRAEPFDVVVDVLAEGATVDTRVAVEIRGPWARPELLLGSDPELPEYQILTLLVTGRVDTVDDADGDVRRRVAALVQRFHQPSLSRQLLDKVGLDRIGVGFGASVSEPILTVGKQVNKKLYVETVYHHNAPPDTNTREGRVELKVGPALTFDTAVGDAAEGSFAFTWRTTFGGARRARLGDTVSLFGKTRLPTDSDGDGIADEKDACPLAAEDLDGHLDGDGCPDPDNDGDGVVDERDQEPDLPEVVNGYRDDDGAPDVVPPRLIWQTGQIRTLELERGSARLTATSQATLETAAGALSELADLRVEVVGHSDDRGTKALVQSISVARARAVERFLIAQGVAPARVTAVGRGADEPRVAADSEEARAANRRVEMRLVR